MNVIVLSIDRLHAGYLGCYGNSWVATPHFNRLAAESFVFDQAIADHPQLAESFGSWWLGRHTLEPAAAETSTLAGRFRAAGMATSLLTDEPRLADHPLAKDFSNLFAVGAASGEPPADSVADEIAQTRAAALFAAAADQLARARPPFFLWVHSQGMEAPWDAPDDFRQQYAEPDEPVPPRLMEIPCRRLTGDEDPDELWGICQAYAGQVSLIDACLGGLLEFVDGAAFRDDTMLVVVGIRGFPLGRNTRMGAIDDALYSELVQFPWFLRLPDGLGAACRSQALVQPCDLAPTLDDFLHLGAASDSAIGRSLLPLVREDTEAVRDRACIIGGEGERALRTPAWHLRLPDTGQDDDAPAGELFAKPDDRWDQNDVADRCPDVVEGLRQALHNLEASLADGATADLPPLDDALVSDLR